MATHKDQATHKGLGDPQGIKKRWSLWVVWSLWVAIYGGKRNKGPSDQGYSSSQMRRA